MTGKNQNWLAFKLGYTKGYVSQLMNQETTDMRMSANVIEGLLELTHLDFDDLFFYNGRPDIRNMYHEVYDVDGEPMTKKRYFDTARSNGYNKYVLKRYQRKLAYFA